MRYIKILSLIFATGLIFSGCSKDQKYVKWLGEGSWKVTSVTLNGDEVDVGGTFTEHTQTYEECKVKDADCNGSESFVIELADGAGTVAGGKTFTYRVHDDGTILTLTTLTTTYDGVVYDCDTDCVFVFDIVEITKDKHVLSHTDANGDVWIRTIEK